MAEKAIEITTEFSQLHFMSQAHTYIIADMLTLVLLNSTWCIDYCFAPSIAVAVRVTEYQRAQFGEQNSIKRGK